MIFDSEGFPRYPEMYFGFVVNNVDPEGLGRVTLTIPGLIEPESDFAWPIGAGGSKQNGKWDIPHKGAGVCIWFHQGDIDVPTWMPGWHANGAAPTPAKEAAAEDADKIKCFESDRHLVVLDARGGKEEVLIKDKQTGFLISLKGDKLELGGSGLVPMVNGLVLAATPCQFTGVPHQISGRVSSVVMAKEK